MALTITYQPTGDGASNSNLLYLVSSDQTAQQEFSYLAELMVNGAVISTRRLSPNNDNNGDFNFDTILASQTSPEYGYFNDPNATFFHAVTSKVTLQVVFHEEYLVDGTLTRMSSATSNELSLVDDVSNQYLLESSLEAVYPLSRPSSVRLHTTGMLPLSVTGTTWTYTINNGSAITLPDPTNTLMHLNLGPTALSQTNDYTVRLSRAGVLMHTVEVQVYNSRSFLTETDFVWWDRGSWAFYTADQEGREVITNTSDNAETRSIRTTPTGFSNTRPTGNSVLLADEEQIRKSYETAYSKNTRRFDKTSDESLYVAGIFDSINQYVFETDQLRAIIVTNSSTERRPIQRTPQSFNYIINYRLANKQRSI